MTVEKISWLIPYESDLHRPGIEPGSPDTQYNVLPMELIGRYTAMNFVQKSEFIRFLKTGTISSIQKAKNNHFRYYFS
jgi:hypothetical protein